MQLQLLTDPLSRAGSVLPVDDDRVPVTITPPAARFRTTSRLLSGNKVHGLGERLARFRGTRCTVWGNDLHGFGEQGARFGGTDSPGTPLTLAISPRRTLFTFCLPMENNNSDPNIENVFNEEAQNVVANSDSSKQEVKAVGESDRVLDATGEPALTKRQGQPATAPFRVLRTNSILAGVPYHRLSKGGTVDIRLIAKEPNGNRLVLRWQVKGKAGPLAYRAHTQFIERRIDELRQQGRLTRLVPLRTSWREIAKELGLGGDTNLAKKAILETAKLDLTAEVRYINPKGVEEYLKAYDFHPYTILERGTKHEGQTLEQIYALLHDVIYTLEKDSATRPLNYDYLKSLSPAPSRFYKYISSKIFGAIKGKRHETSINYSELCRYMPLKRAKDWTSAQRQLYKVHKPHLKSGYLANVRYERIRDREQEPDLVIYYTPGTFAIEEYKYFNGTRKRRAKPQLQPAIDPQLVTELTERGIVQADAKKLLANYNGSDLSGLLEYFDYLTSVKTFDNPPGFLVSLIEKNASVPDNFETSAKRDQRLEQQRSDNERLEKEQQQQLQEQEALHKEMEEWWSALDSDEKEARTTRVDNNFAEKYPNMPANARTRTALIAAKQQLAKERRGQTPAIPPQQQPSHGVPVDRTDQSDDQTEALG